jgi:Cytochrome c7 and related cytochrome c
VSRLGSAGLLLLAALNCLLAAPDPQPLPFSHKQHSSLGLKCAECHANPDPGEHMTFPETSKCMDCHRLVAKDKPSIRKLADFARSQEPIPWVRLYSVPAWVFWGHRAHTESGAQCAVCHGDVAQMEVTEKLPATTTMAGCIACHRGKQVSTGCAFCHDDKN